MIKELNKNNFDSEINSEKPVLVDFWANWCGPCRAQAPILEKADVDPDFNATICKVNVDEEPTIAERYNIMNIPTLIVFKSGQPIKRTAGLQSLQALKEMVNV